MNRVYIPNMIMVENGEFWGGDDNILGLLDFPMESLDDDGYVGDWDNSESQIPGPIPSSVIMGPPGGKIDTGPMYSFPGPVALINASPEQKPNEIPEAQESTVFQTPSPNSVLESSGSCSSGITIKSSNPTRPRSKRARPTGPAAWAQLSPPLFLAAPSSKRTPNIKKNKEKRKNPIESSSSHRPVVTKKCTHCEITKTPQWREGPLGPKTLCNACGVRYRSGRLFPEYRPAASPTFVPYLHSNSHRKVIEMRSKGKRAVTEFDVGPPVSPQPEFVPTSSLMFDFMYN